MPQKHELVGFGELAYDHVFLWKDGSLQYMGSRGGGSVYNLLANFSTLGGDSTAVGVGGDDKFGAACRDELEHLGVNVSRVALLSNLKTRVIFETVHQTYELFPRSWHYFRSKCLICEKKTQENAIAKARLRDAQILSSLGNANFISFDRLTEIRVNAAQELSQHSAKTVLDLGRFGFLRFKPGTDVAAWLEAFDIVLISPPIASFLKNQTRLDEAALATDGPEFLMYVSNGPNGMYMYDTRTSTDRHPHLILPPQVDKVVDNAGAGDAFLAHLLREFVEIERSGQAVNDLTANALIDVSTRSMDGVVATLGEFGARGHLPPVPEGAKFLPERWVGMPLDAIRGECAHEEVCLFCGNDSDLRADERPKPKARVRASAIRNISLLPSRVLHYAERQGVLERCKDVLQSDGTFYTVGTGGSFPVAAFLALLLGVYGHSGAGDVFAQPMRPFDYVRTAVRSDTVIVVSYSGSTADCRDAIIRARQLNARRIILLTAAPDPPLKAFLREGCDHVISYASHASGSVGTSGEKGFISMAGTVGPCALWAAAIAGLPTVRELIHGVQDEETDDQEQFLDRLKSSHEHAKSMLIFGGGFAWPAMWDIESKFVEGDLGIVQLHESKDFSHGRFISVMGESRRLDPAIFLAVENWHPYEQLLKRSLGNERPILEVCSKRSGVLGALELLVHMQFLSALIGTKVFEKNISRPGNIPPRGNALYKWSKGLG